MSNLKEFEEFFHHDNKMPYKRKAYLFVYFREKFTNTNTKKLKM